jgi:uncharacterized protein YwqG
VADDAGKSWRKDVWKGFAFAVSSAAAVEHVLSMLFMHLDAEAELKVIGVIVLICILGAVLVLLLLKPGDEALGRPDCRLLTPEELAECMQVMALSSCPCLKLTLHQMLTTVFESKVGGAPYMPPGFKYPRVIDAEMSKRPLRLLCQLNFEELPHLQGFPEEGILQFYLDCMADDEDYGLDRLSPTRQAGWRIVYHEKIIRDVERHLTPPKLPGEESGDDEFPVEGQFAIRAELSSIPVTRTSMGWDMFWEEVFVPSPTCQRLKQKYTEDEICWSIMEAMPASRHRIGGYPDFNCHDLRDGAYEGHAILLLQLDTEQADGAWVNWGDMGQANFFITPEALAAKDFSNVLFDWN